jgi:uncharacterized protein (DUF433 family)
MKEDQRLYRERIVTDPRILAGKPVVKGTRIAVDLVLEELSHNPDIGELLAAHPNLTRHDVQACLAYAKDIVTGEEVSPSYFEIWSEEVEGKESLLDQALKKNGRKGPYRHWSERENKLLHSGRAKR